MDPLMQLALMWLSAQPGGGAPAARAPAWPTPASPPPMPAFKPAATPTPARGADTGTPLTSLHAASKAPPKATPKAAPKRVAVPKITPGILKSTLSVARLQQALNARGAKLKPDGLFGPKTAAAWSKLASSKGLPSLISRKSPKTAEVVTHTFDALSLPPIP